MSQSSLENTRIKIYIEKFFLSPTWLLLHLHNCPSLDSIQWKFTLMNVYIEKDDVVSRNNDFMNGARDVVAIGMFIIYIYMTKRRWRQYNWYGEGSPTRRYNTQTCIWRLPVDHSNKLKIPLLVYFSWWEDIILSENWDKTLYGREAKKIVRSPWRQQKSLFVALVHWHTACLANDFIYIASISQCGMINKSILRNKYYFLFIRFIFSSSFFFTSTLMKNVRLPFGIEGIFFFIWRKKLDWENKPTIES